MTATADFWKDIMAFHERFGLTYHGMPRILPPDMEEFRIAFLDEELDEYKEACANGDIEKMFDALLDLCYVAVGTMYLHGFPTNEGWKRVQKANIAKIRASEASTSDVLDPDSIWRRGNNFDVIKPKGWMPPTFTDLVYPISDEHYECESSYDECIVNDENGRCVWCQEIRKEV